MNIRILLASSLTALSLGAVGWVVVQQWQVAGLRAEQQQILKRIAQAASQAQPTTDQTPLSQNHGNRNGPEPSMELLRLRNQVTQLSTRRRELAGVEKENQRLRAALAARKTNTAGIKFPPGYILSSQAQWVGLSTPKDTIQSMLWAIHSHDLNRLLQTLSPQAAERIQERVERSSQATQEFFQHASQIPGMRVLSQKQMPNGRLEVRVQILPGDTGEPFHLRQIDGQWRMDDF